MNEKTMISLLENRLEIAKIDEEMALELARKTLNPFDKIRFKIDADRLGAVRIELTSILKTIKEES